MNTPGSAPGGPRKVTSLGKDPAHKWKDPTPKPEGYVPPPTTVADLMLAGKMSPKDVADAIVDEAYGPLKQYCALPEGFSNRVLGYERRGVSAMSVDQIDELNDSPPPMIIDPHPPQIEAIELLQSFLKGNGMVCRGGDPYQPMFGANFVGPPGCGKTHIMSAFARQMKEFLDEKLKGYHRMVADFVNKEYIAYQKAMVRLPNPDEQGTVWNLDTVDTADQIAALDALKRTASAPGTAPAEQKSLVAAARAVSGRVIEQKDPTTAFLDKIAHFKQALGKMQYQPPDFLYLDFEALWELCRGDNVKREQALDAIIRAKVLFLDDLHPKGDIERVQIVLHVIEGRYAAGRMGTFITTNLTTDELAGGNEAHIAERLKSRCSEMFYEVEFKDCVDWRTEVKRRRIELVRQQLRSRIEARVDPPAEEALPEDSPSDDLPPAGDEVTPSQ